MRKTSKKRKIINTMLILVIAILVLGYTGRKVWADSVEKTTIVFNDQNLYNNIKSKFNGLGEIVEDHPESKTLVITNEAIESLTELDLNNRFINNIEGLQAFKNITKLNLSSNSITDISPLSALTGLQELNLSSNAGLSDITTLGQLNQITKLELADNAISTVEPLRGKTNIQTLNLSNNSISDASVILTLTGVTDLDFSKNTNFTDIDEVIMPQLKRLILSDTSIRDITNIVKCRNLEELNLANDFNITSLNPIFKTESTLDGQKAILINLKILHLENLGKSVAFTTMKYLKNLQMLYLQNNGITNVSSIYELDNLDYVNLNENRISSLSGFLKYENGVVVDRISAKKIYLRKNLISDISVFSELSGITELNLAENKISDIKAIEGLKANFSGQNESGGKKQDNLNLRNQDISISVFKKKNNENHYIILYNLLQASRNPNSIIYDPSTTFETSGIELNPDSQYNDPTKGYYNVVIPPTKTSSDLMTVKIKGGVADGSTLTFKITSSNTAIETLRFPDPKLAESINNYLKAHLLSTSYVAEAPGILNITQKEIASVNTLSLKGNEIHDITGLSNFSNLTELYISGNNISDISELSYLTKLSNLDVSNNPLNGNCASIEQLTNLTELNLASTGLTELTNLNNLFDNLIAKNKKSAIYSLTLSYNNLSDISCINKINGLKTLSISGNNISDITPIVSNTPLITLNASGNVIEDISCLTQLTNLRSLHVSNNLIDTLNPLNGMPLTELNMSGNLISDITPLGTMREITDLDISDNVIDDVSVLKNASYIKNLNVSQQKITSSIADNQTGTVTIELPPIFKSAKDETFTKMYTANPFKVANCSLTSDGNSVEVNVDDLKGKIATVEIDGSPSGDRTTLAIAEDLKATITYSNKNRTKDPVTATISFSRDDDVKILNNGGKNTYTFNDSGTFTFKYKDKYGFTGYTPATVTWIDIKGPEAVKTYSREDLTNEDVKVTLTTDEKVFNTIDGWTFENDEHTQLSKTYGQNVESEIVTLKDDLDNTSEVEINITNIDKDPPKVTGVEDGKVYRGSVRPKIEDKNLDTVTLTKDGEIVERYIANTAIQGNGTYKLEVTDKATNKTTINFKITTDGKDDSINSTIYTVDTSYLTISKVLPDTNCKTFKSGITSTVSYKVVDKDNKEVQDNDLIATGCKIITEAETTYDIIVTGDVNGDGMLKLNDVTLVRKDILKIDKDNPLEDVYKDAADVIVDKSLKLNDVTKMRKVILGIEKF